MRVLKGFLLWFLASTVSAEPPNFILIVVDDAAYMDFGGYGGEAATPTINALGDQGVRFTNYHSSPLCAPSRAMLLTGLDNHRAGVATIPEVLTPEMQGKPGYSMHIEEDVETVADKLRRVGYRTLMTGKWHLGSRPQDLPNAHGFDRSFALDASGADNFAQRSYMPYYKGAPWFEDGEPATLPEDFYSSKFIVDKMMTYLEQTPSESPFFAYLAFQAIHIPLQAPQEFINRYKGRYDEGWQALRERRWQRAIELGLIDPASPLVPMPDGTDDWASLGQEERAYYARSMEVNAAMLEAMDHHIGRLVDHLKSTGQFDNTVFIITSDNGPEFNEPAVRPTMRLWMALNGYSSEVSSLGGPDSITHIGPEWASAASSPVSGYKFYNSEGGLRVPLILSGPGVDQRGMNHSLAFATDITPTMLALARVPKEIAFAGKSMDGQVLLPAGGTARNESDMVVLEVSGNVAVFAGDYKLVRNLPPLGDGQFRLHNIVLDPGEGTDLSKQQPERFNILRQAYEDYVDRVGVVALPPDYRPIRQVTINTFKRQLAFYPVTYSLIALVLLALLLLLCFGVFRLLRRR